MEKSRKLKMQCKERNGKCMLIYGILTITVMVVIFLFSAQSGEESGDLSASFLVTFVGNVLKQILPPLTTHGFEYDIRKYAHLTEYLCLGMSMSLFFRELFANRRLLAYLCAELGCFFYACSDEIHQIFIPDRVGCFQDVCVDAFGFTIGVFTVLITNGIVLYMDKKGMEHKIKNKKKEG